MAEHTPSTTALTKRERQRPPVDPPPIPTSWAQRTQRFRCGFIPLVVFLGSGVLAAGLWDRHSLRQDAVGEVFGAQAEVISPVDGMILETIPYGSELLETVHAGQCVARLDDRPVLASLATLRAELARLRAELDAVSEQVRQDEEDRLHDRQVESRRLIVQFEFLRLDILDRKARLAEAQVERQRFQELSQRLTKLIDRNATSMFDVIDAQLRRDAADQRIIGGQEALAEAEAQMVNSLNRIETDDALRAVEREGFEVELLLAPAREAIKVQEASIRELEHQIESLEIRSPIDGQIVAISRWPGQSVRAGDSILTIASAESRYIVSYIRQEHRKKPSADTVVEIRPRSSRSGSFRSRVDRVGPQVLPVPEHQLRDPRVMEWGLPVRIALPAGLELRPGELVDLSFRIGQVETDDGSEQDERPDRFNPSSLTETDERSPLLDH